MLPFQILTTASKFCQPRIWKIKLHPLCIDTVVVSINSLTPHLLAGLHREHIELHVAAAAAGPAGALYLQHRVAQLVLDEQPGVDHAPLLLDAAYDRPGRAGHLHLLQAAGEAAQLAPQRPSQVDHLLALV